MKCQPTFDASLGPAIVEGAAKRGFELELENDGALMISANEYRDGRIAPVEGGGFTFRQKTSLLQASETSTLQLELIEQGLLQVVIPFSSGNVVAEVDITDFRFSEPSIFDDNFTGQLLALSARLSAQSVSNIEEAMCSFSGRVAIEILSALSSNGSL